MEAGLIIRGEQVLLPHSIICGVIEKVHQGGHPGESSLKRHLRMHFWCPNLNKAISSKVKACLPSQAHTDKLTKEPQAMLQLSRSAWDKVSLDLFGPTPTGRRILVAQDVLTRFPAAHIVPGIISVACSG